MSVEFEEPSSTLDRLNYIPSNPRTPIMNLIIKMKLAKTPAQATKVLIAVCVIALVLSFIFAKIFIFPHFTYTIPTIYIK